MSLLSAMVAASKKVADPLVASYASGNRVYTVRLTRPGAPSTFDRATGAYTDIPDEVLYTGPGRIWPITGGASVTFEDERSDISSVRVSIDDYDGEPPRLDDVLEVLDTPQAQAAHLAGRVYEVSDVEVGGHYGYGWHLTGTGIAPSRRT